MNPQLHRRDFMVGAAAGALTLPLVGREAIAETDDYPIYIELGLRDQWDFIGVFVPPSIATYPDLRRGVGQNTAALFTDPAELIDQRPRHDVFLTPLSKGLAPYLDDMAIIETCELPIGTAHGHEGSCPMRLPDRVKSKRPGFLPVWENDGIGQEFANQYHYAQIPALTCLHNHFHKYKVPNPTSHNGVFLYGNGVTDHTVNQFNGTLQGAVLDKFSDFGSFRKHLKLMTQSLMATPGDAQQIADLLRSMDSASMDRRRFSSAAISEHVGQIAEMQKAIYRANPKNVPIHLTPEEIAYWSKDVPKQLMKDGMELWEQAAYVVKLLKHGLVRTISFSFDHDDYHGRNREEVIAREAGQFSQVFPRLIDQLRKLDLWKRTVIAVYTVDGSRGLDGGANGNEGKNTVIIASGLIKGKGGYYGDIRVGERHNDGYRYQYYAPDLETGRLRDRPSGRNNDENRVMGATVWRTIADLLKLEYDYPLVNRAKPLSFLLS